MSWKRLRISNRWRDAAGAPGRAQLPEASMSSALRKSKMSIPLVPQMGTKILTSSRQSKQVQCRDAMEHALAAAGYLLAVPALGTINVLRTNNTLKASKLLTTINFLFSTNGSQSEPQDLPYAQGIILQPDLM